MRNVYVVMGVYYENDGRSTEWGVAAFLTETKAEERVALAKARAAELAQWEDANGESWQDSEASDRPTNEYDPEMALGQDGTSYYFIAVPLADEALGETAETRRTR